MKKIFACALLSSFTFASFFANAQTEITADTKAASFYERTHSQNRAPVEFPSVREADVLNAKYVWRRINFSEKFNQFFYYPITVQGAANQGLENLATIIWNGIMDGKITAYTNDDFTTEIVPEALKARFEKARTDSVWVDNEDGFQELKIIPIQEKFNPADVTQLDIIECWFLDKQRSVQDVRILGMALSKEDYKIDPESGEKMSFGTMEVCWIKYANDPAVRQLLVNKEVYNPRNDADRRTFDDIFVQRYFSSYITKESNVSQRAIAAYLTGIDGLLESEKIKADLMNQEIDMWEY